MFVQNILAAFLSCPEERSTQLRRKRMVAATHRDCDVPNKRRNIQKSIYGKFAMSLQSQSSREEGTCHSLQSFGDDASPSCSRPKQPAGGKHDNALQVLRMIQNSQGIGLPNCRGNTVGQPLDLPPFARVWIDISLIDVPNERGRNHQ